MIFIAYLNASEEYLFPYKLNTISIFHCILKIVEQKYDLIHILDYNMFVISESTRCTCFKILFSVSHSDYGRIILCLCVLSYQDHHN
jgi:hypothetical protein